MAQIQEWLNSNNIAYEEDMTKSELLNIVKCQRPSPKYRVDDILQRHGHEVVRLPPYHRNLNAIEYIWNIVKSRVSDKNVSQKADHIQMLTEEAINSICENDWTAAVSHVKREEEEYWKNDHCIEEEMEKFIIRINGDSESESDVCEDTDSSSDDSGGRSSDGALSGFECLN
ncbi:uncharacterized protein LOC134536307 [Bacillus rossius redtenbacheri]|uniref:uncharacterized protein LOC134536307 n=1 Tax=Bacillus rossius redtenbacheri TaxID=93214 RepID=UPI002FDD5B19